MILPKERIILEEHSTDLLDTKAIMEDLYSRKHNGYMLLRNEEEFVALFSYGRFLGCFDKEGLIKRLEDVLHSSRSISVVALSDATFSVFLGILFGNRKHSRLRSVFLEIRRFLVGLQKDKFTGVIELEGKDNGYIHMEAGIPQDAFLLIEGKVRREEALSKIMRGFKGDSLLNTYELSQDNMRHVMGLQRKTKFVYDRMKTFGAGFHNQVEKRMRELREKNPLFAGASITREGVLHLPFIEERRFLKEKDTNSALLDFKKALISAVSEVSGEKESQALEKEIENL